MQIRTTLVCMLANTCLCIKTRCIYSPCPVYQVQSTTFYAPCPTYFALPTNFFVPRPTYRIVHTMILTASSQRSSLFGHSSQPCMMRLRAVCSFPVTSSRVAEAIQAGGCFGFVSLTDFSSRRAFLISLHDKKTNHGSLKNESETHLQPQSES